MKELNLQNGGRPIYLDDIDILSDSTRVLQTMIAGLTQGNTNILKPYENLVISGCKPETTVIKNKMIWYLSEGYVFINNKLRYVPETLGIEVSSTDSLPMGYEDMRYVITPIDKESEELAKYKNDQTYPLYKEYGAIVTLMDKNTIPESDEADMPYPCIAIGLSKTYDEHLTFEKLIREKSAKAIDALTPMPFNNLDNVFGTPDKITVHDITKKMESPNNTYKFVLTDDSSGLPIGVCEMFYSSNKDCVVQMLATTKVMNVQEDVDPTNPYILRKYSRALNLGATVSFEGKTWNTLTWTPWRNADYDWRKTVNQLNSSINNLATIAFVEKKIKESKTENTNDIDNIKKELAECATKTDVKKIIMDNDNSLVGEIKIWSGQELPSEDYLRCEGQELLQSDYPMLFNVIQHSYDNARDYKGNLQSVVHPEAYFRLPDLRGRFIVGGTNETGHEYEHLGTTGGKNSVLLLSQESGVGSHSHKHEHCHDHVHHHDVGVAGVATGYSLKGEKITSPYYGGGYKLKSYSSGNTWYVGIDAYDVTNGKTSLWMNSKTSNPKINDWLNNEQDNIYSGTAKDYAGNDKNNTDTESKNAEQAHENRPPFYVMSYIIRAKITPKTIDSETNNAEQTPTT